jgi:protein-tyrosine phosphatase
MSGVYRHILDRRAAQIAIVAKALLEPNALPAVIHCAAGKDRTGVTVAVLLAAIGLERDTIARDYALSTECFALPAIDEGDPEDPRIAPIDVSCPPETMLATLDHLDASHGGPRRFLLQRGVTSDELERLRELLTEPATADNQR